MASSRWDAIERGTDPHREPGSSLFPPAAEEPSHGAGETPDLPPDALCLYRLRQFEPCRDLLLSRAGASDFSPDERRLLGFLHARAGEPDQAIALLEAVPEDAAARAMLDTIRIRHGQLPPLWNSLQGGGCSAVCGLVHWLHGHGDFCSGRTLEASRRFRTSLQEFSAIRHSSSIAASVSAAYISLVTSLLAMDQFDAVVLAREVVPADRRALLLPRNLVAGAGELAAALSSQAPEERSVHLAPMVRAVREMRPDAPLWDGWAPLEILWRSRV